MGVERDVEAVSISFVAGVSAAAFMPFDAGFRLRAGLTCILAAVLLALSCGKGEKKAVICLLFTVLGYFCYCNSRIIGTLPSISSLRFGNGALNRILDLAGSCRFSDSTEAIVKALLTGRRDMLDPSVTNAFRKSGASHILALSGLHLGIIYGLIQWLLKPLGNGRAATGCRSILTVALCFFYCISTGASPSLVRAFMFIMVNELARHCRGREKQPLRILSMAMMLQLAVNPQVIESVAFQLSYLSMAGIFILSPLLESLYPKGAKHDPMRAIWKSASLSISCQLFTAPLSYHYFKTFPRYFLLSNLLALPLSEMLVISAIITLIAAGVGLSPALPAKITDHIADILQFSLKVISEM